MITSPKTLTLSLLSTLLLNACQSVPPKARAPGPVSEAIETSKQVQTPPPAPPKAVIDSLIPDAPIIAVNEPRFDVNVSEAEAAKFFAGLVNGTVYNIAVRPEVKGNISLSLRNVSVPEVMEIVRDVYGYEYDRKGNLFTVHPAGLQTAIIPVNYLNLQRKGSSQTRVNSGQVADAGTSEGQSGGSSQGSGGGTRPEIAPATDIKTTSEADLWKELQTTLASLISSSPGSSIVVNPQASLVVVRALPHDLRSVRQYLQSAEAHLQRQVILEAKILEVTLNDGFQAGIDWTRLHTTNSGNTLAVGQTGQVLNLPSVATPLNGMLTTVFNSSDFNATIDLLSTQGTVQVLSSPRVATLNNQKAVIKVGSDEFFVTGISTTTVTGATAATSTPNVTLSPFFSGIALDVMPQISETGDIVLHIHPTVSEVRDQTKSLEFGSEVFSLPLALSTVREADSIVRARSGQIVVIGGLMQDKLTQNDSGVPFLKDIPWLGKLFTQQRESQNKSELVILLRPVVTDDTVWKNEIDRAQKQLNAPLTGNSW